MRSVVLTVTLVMFALLAALVGAASAGDQTSPGKVLAAQSKSGTMTAASRTVARVSTTSLLAPSGRCAYAGSASYSRARQVQSMQCMINYARKRRGLKALRSNPTLNRSARLKLIDMLRCNHFSHTACGKTFTNPFKRAGYIGSGSWQVGENLAWGSGRYGTPRSIMKAWLNSPGHRANILSKQWQEQGLYVAKRRFQAASGASVWTSHFGRH